MAHLSMVEGDNIAVLNCENVSFPISENVDKWRGLLLMRWHFGIKSFFLIL